MQHAPLEHVELATPVHTAPHKFEARHLPFHLPVTVLQREPGLHGCKGADKVRQWAPTLRRLLHLPCAIFMAPSLPRLFMPGHGPFLVRDSAHGAPLADGSAHLMCDKLRMLRAIGRRSRLFPAHFICPLTPSVNLAHLM